MVLNRPRCEIIWKENNGSTNGAQPNKLYSRGTLAYYNDGSFRVETVHHFNELPNYTKIVWAVGGGELFLTQTLTADQFEDLLEAEPRLWDYRGTLSGTSNRGRSGIGYDSSGNVYLFGVSNETGFQGVTMYEFRDIAKRIGCYKAIFLDGGSSAQLKWSDGSELYGYGSISRTSVPTIVKLKTL